MALWESVYALFYVRSTCLQPVTIWEWWRRRRGMGETMLIKISVIFYDYFYYTFFAFVRRATTNEPGNLERTNAKLVQRNIGTKWAS